jgi:hypothetical protein
LLKSRRELLLEHGNRASFADGGTSRELWPDFGIDGQAAWDSLACGRLVTAGPRSPPPAAPSSPAWPALG